MNNQASEDEPINQHLVCLWRLRDIEETIADAEPEELVDLHSKLVALSTDITEAVQALIRTEKLKLLAEVRERVIGEDLPPDVATDSGVGYSRQQFAINMGKPMTNYNERLDDLTSFMESIGWELDENGYTFEDNYINFRTANILRQAITSLIKELVAEAKPEAFKFDDGQNDATHFYNKAVSEYEQNLLKALEEL